MSKRSKNRCFICGRSDHFSKECDKYTYSQEIWLPDYCEKEFRQEQKYNYDSDVNRDDVCLRCGETCHYAQSCCAS